MTNTVTTPDPSPRLVPLRAGMFNLPDHLDAPVRLLGSRCGDCGEQFFPPRVFCAACSSPAMEAVELADRGEIGTFTIVRQQLPGSAMVPPYVIVRVELDGGPAVQTVMVDCDPGSVRIGDRVEIVAHRIKDDEAGNTVVSFVARPRKG